MKWSMLPSFSAATSSPYALVTIKPIPGRSRFASSKTSLLEALFLHSGAVNVSLPFTIEAFRGVTQFQGSFEEALSGLFNDPDSTIEAGRSIWSKFRNPLSHSH